jgi:hypothetical protein
MRKMLPDTKRVFELKENAAEEPQSIQQINPCFSMLEQFGRSYSMLVNNTLLIVWQ